MQVGNVARVAIVGWAALLLAGASNPVSAQGKAVIESSTNTIEILGLRAWTLDMLNDSLRKKVGFDFNSADAHACAAELRYKLGFADAAAITFANRETGKSRTLVTLTEPQDSARIKYRDMPLDTLGGSAAWASARTILRTRPRVFQFAVMTALARTDTSRLPQSMWSDWWAIRETWGFLDANTTPAARHAAILALESEPNIYDRQIAAAILVNFGKDDATWIALSQALLEREGSAKFVALLVMNALVSAKARPSDWSVVAPAVHAVLDGTSQFMMLDLMALLNKVKPGPAMSRPFLKGGGSMLLAYAGSGVPRARDPALDVLRSLRGKDLGKDINAWRKWVASL